MDGGRQKRIVKKHSNGIVARKVGTPWCVRTGLSRRFSAGSRAVIGRNGRDKVVQSPHPAPSEMFHRQLSSSARARGGMKRDNFCVVAGSRKGGR